MLEYHRMRACATRCGCMHFYITTNISPFFIPHYFPLNFSPYLLFQVLILIFPPRVSLPPPSIPFPPSPPLPGSRHRRVFDNPGDGVSEDGGGGCEEGRELQGGRLHLSPRLHADRDQGGNKGGVWRYFGFKYPLGVGLIGGGKGGGRNDWWGEEGGGG